LIRVLQLDRDQEFRSEVAAYFGRLNDLQYRGLDSEAELEAVLNGDKPDVILLDMGLEPESSLAVLARIRARWKMVKLIMVSRTPPGEQI
jgi:DNA-binding response OmpR family regulator